MARPRLDDPTVLIALRMKRSASDWWTAQAKREGTKLPKLIQRVLEEKAARAGKVTYDAGGGLEVELDTGPPRGLPEAMGIPVTARDNIPEGEAYVVSQDKVRFRDWTPTLSSMT